MSSTLERSFALEEGDRGRFGGGRLDPDRRHPRRRHPRQQRRFQLVRGRALDRPHAFRLARGRRSPRRARRIRRSRGRTAGRGRVRAGCRRCTIWRPTPVPSSVSSFRDRLQFGEAGVREFAGEAVGVDRLAHHADADQRRPGRPERVLDRRGDFARQAAHRDRSRSVCPAAGRGSAPGRPFRRIRRPGRVRRTGRRRASGRPGGCRRGCARGSCAFRSARRRRTRRRSGSRPRGRGRPRSARWRGSARCSPSAGEARCPARFAPSARTARRRRSGPAR